MTCFYYDMFLLCMCFMACLAVSSITLVHMYFYLSSNNKLSVDCFVKLDEYLIGDVLFYLFFP